MGRKWKYISTGLALGVAYLGLLEYERRMASIKTNDILLDANKRCNAFYMKGDTTHFKSFNEAGKFIEDKVTEVNAITAEATDFVPWIFEKRGLKKLNNLISFK